MHHLMKHGVTPQINHTINWLSRAGKVLAAQARLKRSQACLELPSHRPQLPPQIARPPLEDLDATSVGHPLQLHQKGWRHDDCPAHPTCFFHPPARQTWLVSAQLPPQSCPPWQVTEALAVNLIAVTKLYHGWNIKVQALD